METRYPEVGVCGLSCRLCPHYHMDTKSRCLGCKTESRMGAGCPFLTCAIQKKGVEFCWDCEESKRCERWKKHREAGKTTDSFKCYQSLETDIAIIQTNGLARFIEDQERRERILREMLREFNEGRSKSYFCIASTVLAIDELEEAISRAQQKSEGLSIKERSRVLHALLDEIASRKGYILRLRKG